MTHQPIFKVLIVGCIAILLFGCKLMPHQVSMEKMTKILQDGAKENKELNIRQKAIPKQMIAALMPDFKAKTHQVADNDELKFDISVRDMPANEFLMSLVDGTPYNMVVPDDINITLSLSLKQVTISEVMEYIKSSYNLEYIVSKKGYEVLPQTVITRTYTIDYLNITRSGSSEMSIQSSSITSNSGNSSSNITTESEANFWNGLAESLSAIVGDGEGRAVVTNPQTSLVIVRAPASEQGLVKEYIDSLENILHRQVVLEVKILEVKLDESYQAGINWGAVGNAMEAYFIGGSSLGGTGIASTTSIRDNVGTAQLKPGSFASPGAIQSANAFGGVFSATFDFSNFAAFVEFLEGQGNVQVLSSPRISTVNNQKAIIKVGTDEYFVTNVSATTAVSSGDSVQTTPSITLEPFFSGIALDVTPQISEDDEVTLHVHPSVSNVAESIKQIDLTGSTQTLPLAKSTIRETDTIVKARSGQIVVIGGLMEHSSDELITNIPVLGHIPFLGALFRQTRQNDTKSELVVLIKPIIVDDDKWGTVIGQSANHFDNLVRGFHFGTKAHIFGTEGEVQW